MKTLVYNDEREAWEREMRDENMGTRQTRRHEIPAEFLATDADARHFTRVSLVALGLLYLHFFLILHHQGNDFGTYPLTLPNWVSRVFSLTLGREAMLATCHHDVHHAHLRVAVLHLPAAGAYLC